MSAIKVNVIFVPIIVKYCEMLIELDHGWGELDKDALEAPEATRRLAACNMDWDRLKADDLLMLFNSFKPKGGAVYSVKVIVILS